MSVTLKDIALEAGVSISTVSRTINGDTIKRPSPETEKKIWKAVSKLGYIPNQNARNLINGTSEKTEKMQTIGIILASPNSSFNDIFFSEMLSHLLDEIQKTKYHLQYTLSASELSKSDFYNKVTSQHVDGAIVLGLFDLETLNVLKANIPHLVYTGVNSVGLCTDEVICDGSKGTQTAIEYLLKQNYETIGFIGPVTNKNNNINEHHRYDSYLQTLKQHDVAIQDKYIRHANFCAEDGYQAMCDIIKEKTYPDAIFCAADIIAVGALYAAYEHHISIPETIAIVGMDDISISKFLTPSLTTIHVPKHSLTRLSVNMLVDRIDNKREMNIRVDVPYELIVRDSCGGKLKSRGSF